jgi:hypothetical protein
MKWNHHMYLLCKYNLVGLCDPLYRYCRILLVSKSNIMKNIINSLAKYYRQINHLHNYIKVSLFYFLCIKYSRLSFDRKCMKGGIASNLLIIDCQNSQFGNCIQERSNDPLCTQCNLRNLYNLCIKSHTESIINLFNHHTIQHHICNQVYWSYLPCNLCKYSSHHRFDILLGNLDIIQKNHHLPILQRKYRRLK